MSLVMALVALAENAKFAGDDISRAWGARWPDAVQPSGFETKDNTFSFRVGELTIICGLMPAPIPWSDLEGPCRHSPLWPEAAEAMRPHKQHIVVTATGQGKGIELLQVLTQATAALVEACEGAIGVFWFHSLVVVSAEDFCAIASEFGPQCPPLPLWVNVLFTNREDGSVQGATRGLSAFGLMEFESLNSPEPLEELRKRLLGLAEYVIENGPIIKDGDTIGESAKEKIRVTYEPSAFGAEGKVMRLDYSTTSPAEQSTGPLRMTTYGCLHALATLFCTLGFGWLLYAYFPILRGSFLRHFLIVPIAIFFGFVLLGVSDKLLQRTFGLQAFEDPKPDEVEQPPA